MQLPGRLIVLPLLLGILPGQLLKVTEAGRGRTRPRNRGQTELSSSTQTDIEYCPPCDIKHCPAVTPQTCRGNIVKDWCNCCPICVSGANGGNPGATPGDTDIVTRDTLSVVIGTDSDPNLLSAPHNANQSEECAKITCPKFQVCMLNIQGIPLCRCPTKFWCAKGDRSPVCGQDDITYKSRCYLKMAECETGKNIPMKYKNKCFKSDKDRMIKEERMKQKELKQQQKLEKRKRKQEKKGRQMKKKLKKEKKERRRHRRGKKERKGAEHFNFKF